MEREDKDASIEDAAVKGGTLRFRAVNMTSWSFILGIFPLIFAAGAGHVSQNSSGYLSDWWSAMCVVSRYVPNPWLLCIRAT